MADKLSFKATFKTKKEREEKAKTKKERFLVIIFKELNLKLVLIY